MRYGCANIMLDCHGHAILISPWIASALRASHSTPRNDGVIFAVIRRNDGVVFAVIRLNGGVIFVVIRRNGGVIFAVIRRNGGVVFAVIRRNGVVVFAVSNHPSLRGVECEARNAEAIQRVTMLL